MKMQTTEIFRIFRYEKKRILLTIYGSSTGDVDPSFPSADATFPSIDSVWEEVEGRSWKQKVQPNCDKIDIVTKITKWEKVSGQTKAEILGQFLWKWLVVNTRVKNDGYGDGMMVQIIKKSFLLPFPALACSINQSSSLL